MAACLLSSSSGKRCAQFCSEPAFAGEGSRQTDRQTDSFVPGASGSENKTRPCARPPRASAHVQAQTGETLGSHMTQLPLRRGQGSGHLLRAFGGAFPPWILENMSFC